MLPHPLRNQTELNTCCLTLELFSNFTMREIVHLQAGQCGNQIGAKVRHILGDGKLKFNSIADFTKISHDTLSLKRTEVNIFD